MIDLLLKRKNKGDAVDYIDIVNNLVTNLKKDGYNAKKISDMRHTFEMLYYQRMILFALVCKAYPDLAFKSKKHFDEVNDPMFNGDFVAGIKTPKGITTFHFKLEYWDLFQIKELDNAPEYDGYTVEEALERLTSLLDNTKFKKTI